MLAYTLRLTQNRFVRNVAIVATGTAGAQAVFLVFTPIITRLYGPEAFGVLGIFTAMITIIAPVAALSYPLAMVLPKKDSDAIGLAKLSAGIALATSISTAVILLALQAPIAKALDMEPGDFLTLGLVFPLAMLFTALTAIGNQWVIRKKLFKIKAKVAVLHALWVNTGKAGMGLMTPVAAALVVITALGSALHAVMLFLEIKKERRGVSGNKLNQAERETASTPYKELARRHIDFACYRSPQIFLNAASQNLPVLMLAMFFGPASAGFYSLGRMVLGAPSALIGQSVASVFYPRINEAVHAGENTHRLILKATLALAAIGIVPFGLIIAFGPSLFALVFGVDWIRAGEYAQWLALWVYFGFINRPSVGAIPVLSLQGFFLIFEIVSILLRAGALALGYVTFESALGAIAIFSVTNVFLNIILIVATILAAQRHDIRGATT